ncbi:MAG: double zinc ribbon domain-containing protein [Planktomarina sp.]
MFQTIINLMYPSLCPACDEEVAIPNALCPTCWAGARFIHTPFCGCCGTQLPGDADGQDAFVCDNCTHDPPPWNQGRAAFEYEGPARSMVLALKHGDRHDLIAPLGQWMAKAGQDLMKQNTVLVPVPLHPFRKLKRRYNQSELLAAEIAKAWEAPMIPKALVRRVYTPSMDHKTKEDRYDVMEGAIAVNPKDTQHMEGKHAILVDDVMTSGATLSACSHALLAAGVANVDVLVLARVDNAIYV